MIYTHTFPRCFKCGEEMLYGVFRVCAFNYCRKCKDKELAGYRKSKRRTQHR